MAKKKNWFGKLKRLFLSDAHSKPEKEKRRRWLFQRLKINTLAPPLQLPPLAEDEQRNHDFTLAIATAAAADAAVTAAQDAAAQDAAAADAAVTAAQDTAEVIRLTAMPQSPLRVQPVDAPSSHLCDKEIQDSAAVKIQTAFRGYLARKALRALKGLVKLQAIVRGRAVRRQAMTTLKCLQSIVSIQSQICELRSHHQTFDNGSEFHDHKEWQDFRNKVMKIEMRNPKRWDDSILTKEEANAVFLSKKEAILKRERIKEYVLSHRRSADQEHKKVNKNLRFWLEQWVDTKLAKIEDLEENNSVISSNPRTKNHASQYRLEGLVSPISAQRRSFHQKKQSSSNEEQGQFDKNPTPTYMLATESAKNKSRLMGNSPKLRPVSFDTFSEGNSPYKNKLSVLSSVSSEVISSGRMGKFDGFHYRSPSLKGYNGNVKLGRVLKDQSFDSECSLFNWDRYSSFR